MKKKPTVPKPIRDYMARIARRQLETMTPAERSARARNAVKTRWEKNRRQKTQRKQTKGGTP